MLMKVVEPFKPLKLLGSLCSFTRAMSFKTALAFVLHTKGTGERCCTKGINLGANRNSVLQPSGERECKIMFG